VGREARGRRTQPSTTPLAARKALHPYLTGQPQRIAALDEALAHIVAHDGVWLATGREIAAWYTAADVFTLPSVTESFGLVYLEALASGRPVVGTDDAVRREVIGGAGLCCDVENIETYAGALERALTADWGDRPRRQAERFSFTHTADAYAQLLRDVVRERERAFARAASRSARDRRGVRRGVRR